MELVTAVESGEEVWIGWAKRISPIPLDAAYGHKRRQILLRTPCLRRPLFCRVTLHQGLRRLKPRGAVWATHCRLEVGVRLLQCQALPGFRGRSGALCSGVGGFEAGEFCLGIHPIKCDARCFHRITDPALSPRLCPQAINCCLMPIDLLLQCRSRRLVALLWPLVTRRLPSALGSIALTPNPTPYPPPFVPASLHTPLPTITSPIS